jgi:hypothetical protein
MTHITQISFLRDEGVVEELAVGKPLPAYLHFNGSTAAIMEPHLGFVGILCFSDIRADEKRAFNNGHWQIGLMEGGPHATIVHCRFARNSFVKAVLKPDFGFSAVAQVARGLPDPRLIVTENMLFSMVLVAEETGMVRGLRQARISAAMADAWKSDMTRQFEHAQDYSTMKQERTVAEVLAKHPNVERAACFPYARVLECKTV